MKVLEYVKKIKDKDVSNFEKIKDFLDTFNYYHYYCNISYESDDLSFLLQHLKVKKVKFTTMIDKHKDEDVPRFEIEGTNGIYHIHNLENCKVYLSGYDEKLIISITNYGDK